MRVPDLAALATADVRAIASRIRLGGLERVKAKYLKEITREVLNRRGNTDLSFLKKMDPGEAEAWLTSLPGVARKTANIVLSSSFRKAVGIAVDTHVKRLSGRIGLSAEKYPEKIEKDLMKTVPRKDWLDFNYLLVSHGRRVCAAKKPLCPQCVIRNLCPSAGKCS